MAADEAFGALEQPDADRDRDPDQHAGREHVLDQAQPVGAADQRELESRIDQLARDLDDRGQQDQEPPEDERVHQAGERALEELPLAQDLDALTGDPARDVPLALDRAAEPHEPRQQPGSPGGQAPGDHHEHGEEAGTHEHRREHTPPRRSEPPGGRWVTDEAAEDRIRAGNTRRQARG